MFILFSTDDDRQLPTEYLPCSAIQPKYGMAMYLTGGKLAAASVANRAEYICVQQGSAAVTAGTPVAVVKLQEDQVWTADVASGVTPTVGTGLDVASGGLTVTTKDNSTGIGNFIPIAAKDGDGKVRGRFKTTA